MPSSPTPAAFAALIKEVLGVEHPRNFDFDPGERCWYRGCDTVLDDADALDLLAAFAWREVNEKCYGLFYPHFDPTPEPYLNVMNRWTHEWSPVFIGSWRKITDPANVFALLEALKEKGVKPDAK